MEQMILTEDIGTKPKPAWLAIRPPTGQFSVVKDIINKHGLHTVCEEAHCPNMAECWSGGTATFMILGDKCTRGCRFCNVKTSVKGAPVDEQEPEHIVTALNQMGIFEYVVLTSVDRDDLPDQGSSHFARCIQSIKASSPEMLVEVLIPDFRGVKELIDNIIRANPDVIAHNLETVQRLQGSVRDRMANYAQSLSVLAHVKRSNPKIITKSSLMLGLGETKEEVIQSMKDLLAIGVEILTLGQYLRPSHRYLPVKEYVSPDVFRELKIIGEDLGFTFVAAGPLVRSSYRAGELFIKHFLRKHA